MNKNKILGIVRHALTFGGGWVVAQGWVDEGNITEVIGAAMTIIGAVWSYVAPEKKDS
jgi:hypothetical protein